jgi:nucleotide-binding universal stress UspA family protein
MSSTTRTISAARSKRGLPRIEGPVVVATDGLEGSDSAVRAGLSLTPVGGIVYVVAVMPPLPVVTPEAQLPITEEILEDRRAALYRDVEQQLARVGVPASLTVVVRLEDGEPTTTVEAIGRKLHARMIISGLGRHALMDRLFGAETTLGLMRVATVPVFAAGPHFAGAPLRVVVAVDFSEPSIRAARHALAVAAPKAVVDLVHVTPAETGPAWRGWGTEYRRAARVELVKVKARLEIPAGTQVNTVLLAGDPATTILDHAREAGADLIATGSHGHGFIGRLLIGSVATKIVRSASMSVLCVPHMVALREQMRMDESSTVTLLPRDDWDIRLDHFTRRNTGRAVVIEVDDPDLGARAQGHGYPLAGITFDRHDGHIHVMLGAIGDRKRHLSRDIGGVTSIDVITDGHGLDLGLRIGHGEGETVLTFTR